MQPITLLRWIVISILAFGVSIGGYGFGVGAIQLQMVPTLIINFIIATVIILGCLVVGILILLKLPDINADIDASCDNNNLPPKPVAPTPTPRPDPIIKEKTFEERDKEFIDNVIARLEEKVKVQR